MNIRMEPRRWLLTRHDKIQKGLPLPKEGANPFYSFPLPAITDALRPQ
jgi:hypothetical protein